MLPEVGPKSGVNTRNMKRLCILRFLVSSHLKKWFKLDSRNSDNESPDRSYDIFRIIRQDHWKTWGHLDVIVYQ